MSQLLCLKMAAAVSDPDDTGGKKKDCTPNQLITDIPVAILNQVQLVNKATESQTWLRGKYHKPVKPNSQQRLPWKVPNRDKPRLSEGLTGIPLMSGLGCSSEGKHLPGVFKPEFNPSTAKMQGQASNCSVSAQTVDATANCSVQTDSP